MIYAGCSGYGYREWVGRFYPPGTSSKDFLSVYASRLASVEVNHTFRRFPRVELVDSWAGATPPSFRFSLKMHQSVTHRYRLRNVSSSVRDFLDALLPLGPRLGVVLFQLPPFFRRDLERLDAFLADLPEGHRYAMEFRHESWNESAVVERLRAAGVCLCAAEIQFGGALPEPPVTASFAYVRLRKTPPYDESEIAAAGRFVRALGEKVEDVYLYVKHDDAGVAPEQAARIRELGEESI